MKEQPQKKVIVAAGVPALVLADPMANASAIIGVIDEAAAVGARALALPRLCVTGCACGDLFLQQSLQKASLRALIKIVENTAHKDILVFVGLPMLIDGKLFDARVSIFDGKIMNIETNGNFDEAEKRWFSDAHDFRDLKVEIDGASYRVGGGLIFPFDNFYIAGERKIRMLMQNLQSVCCICGAEKEIIGARDDMVRKLAEMSKNLGGVVVFASAGEGESVSSCVYGGRKFIFDSGKLVAEGAPFCGGLITYEVDLPKPKRSFADCPRVEFTAMKKLKEITRTPFVPSDVVELQNRSELILTILSRALASRVEASRSKAMVLGVSGGLDSSLALLVAMRAKTILEARRRSVEIIAVTMPSKATSDETFSSANALIGLAGVKNKTINIAQAVERHLADIGHDLNSRDTTYENAQARIRTLILMNIANSSGGIVLGTGDMSELALGWCTYNGDQMSMYGVNSNVPKTLIPRILDYEGAKIGGEMQKVLRKVCNTDISPELLPPRDGKISQKTEEIIGSYELNDFILYWSIGKNKPIEEVYAMAQSVFDIGKDELKKWFKSFFRRFIANGFKRSCTPDSAQIGSVSLSPLGGLIMPNDASSAAWLAHIDEFN